MTSDTALRVSAHVWAIPLHFALPLAGGRTAPRLVHAYIIAGASDAALVDCGTAANAQQVRAGIEGAGIALTDIHLLIATHEHADHMGAAHELVRASGWRVAAHRLARRWLEDADLQARERPLLGFGTLMSGSVEVSQPLDEGSALDLGGCTVHILHTPGHSIGSISLLVEPDNVLITGDVLIRAVGAPFYDDPRAVLASVEHIRHAINAQTAMLSSHAPSPSAVPPATLDETVALVNRLAAATEQAVREVPSGDGDALIRRALDLGGWPEQSVMPLTRITVQSHLR
jgi:glyoxylase-like metal-dependent hydrolase (beta-lactamase superfamily II)